MLINHTDTAESLIYIHETSNQALVAMMMILWHLWKMNSVWEFIISLFNDAHLLHYFICRSWLVSFSLCFSKPVSNPLTQIRASKSITGHRATGIILFSVRWGLMSENSLNYRREVCHICRPTDIPFDILGATWRLLWKANLLTTGHLFPQALECRSSGCLQTLAAGQPSPRWAVKAVHTVWTLGVLASQPPCTQTSNTSTSIDVVEINCVWVSCVTGAISTSFMGVVVHV